MGGIPQSNHREAAIREQVTETVSLESVLLVEL